MYLCSMVAKMPTSLFMQQILLSELQQLAIRVATTHTTLAHWSLIRYEVISNFYVNTLAQEAEFGLYQAPWFEKLSFRVQNLG